MPKRTEIGECCYCFKEFPSNELYWHNFEIVGFFCDRCFNFIAEQTGSILRYGSLKEVRERMAIKEDENAKKEESE